MLTLNKRFTSEGLLRASSFKGGAISEIGWASGQSAQCFATGVSIGSSLSKNMHFNSVRPLWDQQGRAGEQALYAIEA